MTLLKSDDQGSVSELVADSGFRCLIQELPDRQNCKGHSRVNGGTVLVEWAESPSHGSCYHLRDVGGRDHVLIHPGNLAGDVEMGYASDAEGCLLPGAGETVFREGETVGKHLLKKDQRGVSSSVVTTKALAEEMHRGPFMLTINR